MRHDRCKVLYNIPMYDVLHKADAVRHSIRCSAYTYSILALCRCLNYSTYGGSGLS
jgi:hypothetical protein